MKKVLLILWGVSFMGFYSCNNHAGSSVQTTNATDTLAKEEVRQPDTLHFKNQIISPELIDSNLFLAIAKLSYQDSAINGFDSLNEYAHDSTLVLILESGDSVKLVSRPNDQTESFIKYNYKGFIVSLNSYITLNAYYESHDFSLINRKTGKETVVYGVPVLSPGKEFAVSFNSDIMAMESPNGFQILSVKPDGTNIVWEANPLKWGPEECRWKDDHTLYIRATYLDTTANRKEKFLKIGLPDFTK